MAMWLFLLTAVIALFLLYWFNAVARFYFKAILYGISILVSSALGSMRCIGRNVSPSNHTLIFDVLHAIMIWARIDFVIENAEILDTDEPCIVIANHQSALDVYTMSRFWPSNCVVMLKKSLQYLPFFNVCAWKCESIFIDRFHKDKAHQSIEAAVKSMQSGKKLFMYPEGTRNNKPQLLPFKKGAFVISKNANVPLVPCVFSPYKPFYNYDESKWLSRGRVVVKVLPKMYPEGKDVDQLSDECWRIMNDTFQKMGDIDKKND